MYNKVTLFLKKPNLFAGKPIGCQRNEECRNTEICVSGTCINPCLVDDPCGANAECYPQDHRSEWLSNLALKDVTSCDQV